MDAWVEAFTSGDPAKLRLTVGDPDPDHTYTPMGGLVGAKSETRAAAWNLGADGRRSTSMLVQLTWPGAHPRNSGARGATYDLLVRGADAGAPRVVAWGGPGTGPMLVEYANAVLGRAQDEAPMPDALNGPPATQGATLTSPGD